MKKHYLIYLIVFLFAGSSARAQSNMEISHLFSWIQEGKVNFKNYLGKKTGFDSQNNQTIFESKDQNPGAVTKILQTKDGQNIYSVSYAVKGLSADDLVKVMHLVDVYIDNMNTLVKMGTYTGRDYQASGLDITELKDLKGNKVMEYFSNPGSQNILMYGLTSSGK